jgi:hypothetical protein
MQAFGPLVPEAQAMLEVSTDMVGKRFGGWTVQQVEGRRFWCACLCGEPRLLTLTALLASSARSGCGCIAVAPASQNGRKHPVKQPA